MFLCRRRQREHRGLPSRCVISTITTAVQTVFFRLSQLISYSIFIDYHNVNPQLRVRPLPPRPRCLFAAPSVPHQHLDPATPRPLATTDSPTANPDESLTEQHVNPLLTSDRPCRRRRALSLRPVRTIHHRLEVAPAGADKSSQEDKTLRGRSATDIRPSVSVPAEKSLPLTRGDSHLHPQLPLQQLPPQSSHRSIYIRAQPPRHGSQHEHPRPRNEARRVGADTEAGGKVGV